MNKILMVVAIVFSLAILPAIDAVACEIIHSEQADSGTNDKSPIDGKCDKVSHCCCHHQIADKSAVISLDKIPVLISAKLSTPDQNPYGSIITGPLLKPPSHS